MLHSKPDGGVEVDPVVPYATCRYALAGMGRTAFWRFLRENEVPVVVVGGKRGLRLSTLRALLDDLPVLPGGGIETAGDAADERP